MPGGGGVRAATEIREGSPSIKLVAVSADDSQVAQYEMSRAGAVGYVVKGAPDDEIVRAIRSARAGEDAGPSGPGPAGFAQGRNPRVKALPELRKKRCLGVPWRYSTPREPPVPWRLPISRAAISVWWWRQARRARRGRAAARRPGAAARGAGRPGGRGRGRPARSTGRRDRGQAGAAPRTPRRAGGGSRPRVSRAELSSTGSPDAGVSGSRNSMKPSGLIVSSTSRWSRSRRSIAIVRCSGPTAACGRPAPARRAPSPPRAGSA